jgi:hypothetical protein
MEEKMSQTIKERKALCLNNKWRYSTAEESKKPGYLARKCAKIKADMEKLGPWLSQEEEVVKGWIASAMHHIGL